MTCSLSYSSLYPPKPQNHLSLASTMWTMHGSPLMFWEMEWYDLRLIHPSEFIRSDFTVARIAHARLQYAPVFIRGNEPRFITTDNAVPTNLPPGTQPRPQPLFNVPTPLRPSPLVYVNAAEQERRRQLPETAPSAAPAAVELPRTDLTSSGPTAPQPDTDSEVDEWKPTKAPIPKQLPARLPDAAWGTEPPNPNPPKAPPPMQPTPQPPTAWQSAAAVRVIPEDPWTTEPNPARQPAADEVADTSKAEPVLPAPSPTAPGNDRQEQAPAPEADTEMTEMTATTPELPTTLTTDEENALQGTTVVRHNTPETTHAWATACPFRRMGYWPGTDHRSANCYVCNNHAVQGCEQCQFSFCRKHFTNHS